MDKHITRKALRIYHAYNPKYFPACFFQQVFGNCAFYFNLWLSSEIVNALYEGRDRQQIFALVATALFGNLAIQIFKAILTKKVGMLLKRRNTEEAAAFNRKMLSLDYDKLEDPEIRTLRRKIRENAYINWNGIKKLGIEVEQLMSCSVNLLFCLLFFGEMFLKIAGAGLRPTGILLLAAMILCMVCGNAASSKYNRQMAVHWDKVNEQMLADNRLGNGYSTMGLDNRIYRQQAIIRQVEQKSEQTHKRVFCKANRMDFLYSIPGSVLSGLLELCAYLLVVFYCTLGVFPVGSVIRYVGYLGMLTSALRQIFHILNEMKSNEIFLKDYLAFFDIKNDMYQGSLAVEKRSDKQFEIEFKNVSFRYPGAKEYALKDLNLRLKVGERLAVVGMNGSGKTTFIKLLCRLYDPAEGEIIMNDFNIRKYDYRQYLDLFSVVFQDYHLLSMPLGKTVACAESWDTEKAERLLHEVGFGERYGQMEKKLDTPLYKDFDRDGVNVSGGEAQKIALARALYRDAPFIILDEPTAALDPIAEAEIYSKFDEIVEDKTAIYISHRLSSCRFCDKIAVFHEGRIIQVGTHEELLADTDGKYYELWNAQAQYYQEKNTGGGLLTPGTGASVF